MRAITARDFNQDPAGAKRAAQTEPVFILDRGQPSHVLMSIAHYQALVGSSPNIADLLGRARSVPTSALYLSVTSIAELEIGIGAVERRDMAQHRSLRTWMDNFVMPAFAGRILDVNLPVVLRCAALHQPQPRPERDALVAATALHHGMKVVTRNVGDFAGMVELVNPWEQVAR